MGRKGTADLEPEGRDPREPTQRELRRTYLMLQLSCEWAGTDFSGEQECREALSSWTSQAEGCGVREIAKAARSIREAKALVVDAWITGRTNAYAENANRKIKDVKRRSRGSAKCENMRRRLLLAFGYPPLDKGGVPPPNRNERAAEGGSPGSPEDAPLV